MTCGHCQAWDDNRLWGGYSVRCVDCCARLVRSARPLKHAQDAHLAAIALRPENPARADILLALKALDARLGKP